MALPRRHLVVLLSSLGGAVTLLIRLNIAIAVTGPTGCAFEFHWTNTQTAWVISSFYVGYSASQVLGGHLSIRFGGKRVHLFSVLWSCVGEALTPLVAGRFELLIILRVLMGLGEGPQWPSCYKLFSHWVPTSERSRAVSFFWAMGNVAIAASLMLTPVMQAAWGWRASFFVFSAVGGFWALLFSIFVSSSPGGGTCGVLTVSQEEIFFIRSQIVDPSANLGVSVPWRRILAAPAVWVLTVTHFCSDWPKYVLVSFGPTFLSTALGFNLSASGIVSAVPYFGQTVACTVAGLTADALLLRGVPVRLVRSLMMAAGMLLPGLVMVGIGFSSTHVLAVTLFSLPIALSGFASAGFAVNHLEIAPAFAGILMGFTNSFANTAGFLGPVVAGATLDAFGCTAKYPQTTRCLEGWKMIWVIAGAIYVLAALYWMLFARYDIVIAPPERRLALDGVGGSRVPLLNGGEALRRAIFSTYDLLPRGPRSLPAREDEHPYKSIGLVTGSPGTSSADKNAGSNNFSTL